MLRCATYALCLAWCARLQVPDTVFWVLGILMSLKVVSDIAARLNETKLGVQKLVEKQVVVCGVFWAACRRGGLIAFGQGRGGLFWYGEQWGAVVLFNKGSARGRPHPTYR